MGPLYRHSYVCHSKTPCSNPVVRYCLKPESYKMSVKGQTPPQEQSVPIGIPIEKGPRNNFSMICSGFFGRQGGRASGRLDLGLETPSGEAALAADLFTASPGRTTASHQVKMRTPRSRYIMFTRSSPGKIDVKGPKKFQTRVPVKRLRNFCATLWSYHRSNKCNSKRFLEPLCCDRYLKSA